MTKRPVYFVITLEQGKNRRAGHPMREQEHWQEHAKLMDTLVDEGFIFMGGPLNNEEKAMLIINAESQQAVEAALANDPWLTLEIRRIASIDRWEILLGTNQ